MSIQEWQKKGKYLEHKGHKIFYIAEGQKEQTILLLHGFPTASWDFEKIWAPLLEQYSLITLDFIGFGFSDKPKDYNYLLMDQADIVEEVLNKLNIQNFHILAHDYAVSVAQELLARYEDNKESYFRIQSICFLNGGLFPEMHRARPIQNLLKGPFGFLAVLLFSKKKFIQSFEEIFGNKKASKYELDSFWELMILNNGHRLSHKLIHYITDRKKYRERWVGNLIKTKLDIVMINGIEDPVSGLHLAHYFEKMKPGSKVIKLEGVGHYPQTEAPEEVLNHYFSFLNTLKINNHV